MPWPLLLMALALVQQTGPVVRVESGALRGTIDSATGVQVFRGIPYEAKARWKGVRPADRLGKNCIQKTVYDDIDAFAVGVSKHCQFLNIWTTGTPHQAVMFWIHGGGFVAGFGGEARHNGANLARKGVVVVTINYRLGPAGFVGGNFGLLDQIAALHWVQRNIARFGGDPERVTVFGESAGAMSIGALMVSPLAQGLFQRAILESGTGIHNGFSRTTDTSQLRPIIDGKVLPQPVDSALANGPVQPVPIIVGNNADEPDSTFGAPAREFAHLVAARGVNVYRYVFTYAQDDRGAYHSAEIPFVFDLAAPPLADTMSDYWAAFASTGDPNGGGRPAWPLYNLPNHPYLELGAVVRHIDRP